MKILGIETSCDETAASVVEDGRIVHSNAVYTQAMLHRKYGGVVPEIASRKHIDKLPYVVDQALSEAGLTIQEIDAVGVTVGPGLVGALLTGVAYAKAFAYAAKKPLVPVNHIEGHICSNYISSPDLKPPFVCLVVSGGHTHIAVVRNYGEYELLGSTRDDAAGEAFDKIARVLGLPYPGGPELEKLAEQGDAQAYAFPRGFQGETHLDFTFSGLKTAVINKIRQMEGKGETFNRADIAASFQKAVVDVLVANTFQAVERTGIYKVALAGGVSANGALRRAFQQWAKELECQLYLPELKYSTDNAAMIASAAYYRFIKGERAPLEQNANPSLSIF